MKTFAEFLSECNRPLLPEEQEEAAMKMLNHIEAKESAMEHELKTTLPYLEKQRADKMLSDALEQDVPAYTVIQLSRAELRLLAKELGNLSGYPWYSTGMRVSPGDTISFKDRNGARIEMRIVERKIDIEAC